MPDVSCGAARLRPSVPQRCASNLRSTRAQLGYACVVLCFAGGNARAQLSVQRQAQAGAESSLSTSPGREAEDARGPPAATPMPVPAGPVATAPDSAAEIVAQARPPPEATVTPVTPSAESVSPPAAASDSFAAAWSAPEPWRTDRFYFETSVYTHHWSYSPQHDNNQNLILGEWNITEQWLAGASFFNNSFGQPSEFVYGGYRFRPFEQAPQLYFKVAAGILHGYSGEFQNKIPLNSSGFAPAIVPSVGYCISRFCSELVIFGTAGVLLTVGVTVP
jgi:hypothetical protein